MEEIPNNYLGFIQPWKYLDKLIINWWSPDFWTINSISEISEASILQVPNIDLSLDWCACETDLYLQGQGANLITIFSDPTIPTYPERRNIPCISQKSKVMKDSLHKQVGMMDIWGMFLSGFVGIFLETSYQGWGLFCTHVLVDDSNDMMIYTVGMRKTFPATQNLMGIILLSSLLYYYLSIVIVMFIILIIIIIIMKPLYIIRISSWKTTRMTSMEGLFGFSKTGPLNDQIHPSRFPPSGLQRKHICGMVNGDFLITGGHPRNKFFFGGGMRGGTWGGNHEARLLFFFGNTSCPVFYAQLRYVYLHLASSYCLVNVGKYFILGAYGIWFYFVLVKSTQNDSQNPSVEDWGFQSYPHGPIQKTIFL